jgi:hypothetical protein
MKLKTDHKHDGDHVHDENHPARDAYFMLGELVVLARYNRDEVGSGQISEWLQKLSKMVKSDYPLELVDADKSIPTFQTEESGAVSFLHVRVKTSAQGEYEDVPAIEEAVIKIVNVLNKSQLPEDAISFVSASPNWLFCSASHGFGDGGPGGLPVPVLKKDKNRYKFKRDKVKTTKQEGRKILGIKPPEIDETASHPVNVVIFDTAYHQEVLDIALEKYPSNALLSSLYPSHLKTYTASALGITMPPSPSQSPHHYSHKKNYNMRDHGLFIAGIVQSWCPNAQIYLVEVLNSYGVCTLQGLAQAFDALNNHQIIDGDREGLPLIINCSLCITFPAACETESSVLLEYKDYRNQGAAPTTLAVENSGLAMEALRLLFEGNRIRYSAQGVRIVAAAGNDGHASDAETSTEPPSARYPAAFENIVGVGAIEKDTTRAWYSNKADSPPNLGLMVFGGQADSRTNKAVRGEGMLGLYIGHFPDETGVYPDGIPSTNGLGWWSGTSFATAVMSGMLALGVAQGHNISSAAPVDLVDIFKSGADSQTALGEPVLDTPQQ